MKTGQLILACLAMLVGTTMISAQKLENSWENLKQLKPGHKIKIVDTDLKAWEGKLVRVSEESILFREKQTQQEMPLERAKVLRVTDLQRSHRVMNSLIGAGIGVGLGGALTWGRNEENDNQQFYVPGLFGLIGAGTGAAIPNPRPTVYRRIDKSSDIETNKPD